MDFKQDLPEWSAEGTEPPASLKQKGFEAGYKPPAAYFNWFWHRVSACLKEIREKMKQVRTVADGGTGKNSVTSGNYLVGNGTDALTEKTPAEVREHIGAAKKNEAIPVVDATSEDGISYTATVEGLTELRNGMLITIIPNVDSTSTAITLNVNGIGEKPVRLPLSTNTALMVQPKTESYFVHGRSITLQYDSNYVTGGGWKTYGKQRPSASDLYGTVPVENGGTGADNAKEALENLGAVPLAGGSMTGALGAPAFKMANGTIWDGNTTPSKMPDGISYVSTANGTNAGFPATAGTCICVNENSLRCFEVFVEKGTGIEYTRAASTASTWSSWVRAIPAVTGATEGHIPTFNASGILASSGVAMSGFDRCKFTLSGTTLTITTVS